MLACFSDGCTDLPDVRFERSKADLFFRQGLWPEVIGVNTAASLPAKVEIVHKKARELFGEIYTDEYRCGIESVSVFDIKGKYC